MNKHNVKLLITRPEKKGQELSQFLEQHGICCYQQAFFDYQSKDCVTRLNQLQQTMPTPFFIFVSVAAVEFANKCLALNQWHTLFGVNSHFFAVGKATAQALESLGFDAITPKQENSEGLLTLTQLCQVNNKNIIIVRGDGGREHLANTLTERGANVAYFESYQRVWRNFSKNLATSWREKQINYILVTSNAILEALTKHISPNDNYWLEHCTWVVISARIAKKAQQLGIKKIIHCASADHKAILLALKSMND